MLMSAFITFSVKSHLRSNSIQATFNKFFMLVFGLSLTISGFSQSSTNINIFDSTGATATARISNGNLYFNDSNGSTAIGTIRQGNVFITSSSGEVTFGTLRTVMFS